jgi:hypothetical protein
LLGTAPYLKATVTAMLDRLIHHGHIPNPKYFFEVGANSRIIRATPVFMRLWEQNELHGDPDPR